MVVRNNQHTPKASGKRSLKEAARRPPLYAKFSARSEGATDVADRDNQAGIREPTPLVVVSQSPGRHRDNPVRGVMLVPTIFMDPSIRGFIVCGDSFFFFLIFFPPQSHLQSSS